MDFISIRERFSLDFCNTSRTFEWICRMDSLPLWLWYIMRTFTHIHKVFNVFIHVNFIWIYAMDQLYVLLLVCLPAGHLGFMSVRNHYCLILGIFSLFYQITNRGFSLCISQFERADVPNALRIRVSCPSKPWFHIQTARNVWIRWRYRSTQCLTFDK